jgi:hypothetical protein
VTADLRVLIVGGYGVFGGRIIELLEDEPRLTIMVGGRSEAKAQGFIASRKNAKARLLPCVFDRNGDAKALLGAIRPDIVVDASGPFQTYGSEPYRIVEFCLEQKVHYLDLADASEFVAGIAAFDERAKDRGIFVLSGVSSCPVLTAAAVRRLSSEMIAVKAIRGGIAPSPFAGVGESVVRAISAYAGEEIQRRRNGAFATGYPFTEQLRYTIAPPGFVPLRNTLFSLVDVPDLLALPAIWPEADDVWIGAGPVPEILHRILIGLAWLRRWRLLPALSLLSPLMYYASNHFRWGERRSGMFVEVEGIDQSGRRITRSWHLLAEGDDGPFVPAMAVEAVVREMLDERVPAAGARAAVRDIELDAYERSFSKRAIYTGTRYDVAGDAPPLYARILGEAWDRLPPPIRDMHDIRKSMTASGHACVERGGSLLARLACTLIGFPKTNSAIPVRVQFDPSNDAETWTRKFGQEQFSSRQFAGRKHYEWLLCERFGPFTFAMAPVLDGARLLLVLRHWTFFGLALPMWLGPRSEAYETAEAGRFNFHVAISHPLAGLIVRYDGWLERAAETETQIGARDG